MSMIDELKSAIDRAFSTYVAQAPQGRFITGSEAAGKVYEVFALGVVAERLSAREHLSIEFVPGYGGAALAMKAGGGGINRSFPHLRVRDGGSIVAELWTDIEFQTLSCTINGGSGPTCMSHTHELDLVMVDPGIVGYPEPHQIWLGVECKHTAFRKDQIRALLGVRRELSLLSDMQPTRFRNWPDRHVPAQPASSVLFFSSDPRVTNYPKGPRFFGIHVEHLVP